MPNYDTFRLILLVNPSKLLLIRSLSNCEYNFLVFIHCICKCLINSLFVIIEYKGFTDGHFQSVCIFKV